MTASIGSVFASTYIRPKGAPRLNHPTTDRPPSDDAIQGFGTLSLKSLHDAYSGYLFDDFLPFMEKYVIDHTYGGFMCNTDLTGAHMNTKKDTWTEGRGIWVYSFLYRHFGQDEKYLAVARNSLNLILKTKPPNDDLWPASVSREGVALTPSSKEIAGDVLVAEGLSEYAYATGEWKYWNVAKEIILKCWKIYNTPTYAPDIVAGYQGPKPLPFPGAKIQAIAMLMIVTINNMLESKEDPDLEQIISECTDAVIAKHFNPEFGLNNELLNHDYSRPINELAQFVYTGIANETLWPIMKRAMKLKDVQLYQVAAERFKRHVEVAWDDVYGGVFRSLNNVDKNLWEVDVLCKVLWAQQEVLNGIVLLIEQTGDRWAKDEWFGKMYTYLVDRFLLKQRGYPLWITGGDRKVTFDPHTYHSSIENYHLPRHLMLTYLALDRMSASNGTPAWEAAARAKSER